MSQFPVNPDGKWAIYSVQKPLDPGFLGDIEAKLHWIHNYLVLVNAQGQPVQEIQGMPSNQFTLFAPVSGDYLDVRMLPPNEYMYNDPILSKTQVFSGSHDDMWNKFQGAYDSVHNTLNSHQFLYVGASPFEPTYNSNSVWYTALKSMGIKDPSQYEGGYHTAPGDMVDLTHATSNLHDVSFVGNMFNGVVSAIGNAEGFAETHPAAAIAISLAALLTTTAGVAFGVKTIGEIKRDKAAQQLS